MASAIKKVSSITDYEFLVIVTSIEAQFESSINCTKCVSKFNRYKEEKKIEKLEVYKKAKGCYSPRVGGFSIGNNKESTNTYVKYEGCPGNYTSYSVNYYIDLFFKQEQGVLPYEGKLGDQPAKVIEIFQLISDRIYTKKKEKYDIEVAKAKKNQGKK